MPPLVVSEPFQTWLIVCPEESVQVTRQPLSAFEPAQIQIVGAGGRRRTGDVREGLPAAGGGHGAGAGQGAGGAVEPELVPWRSR